MNRAARLRRSAVSGLLVTVAALCAACSTTSAPSVASPVSSPAPSASPTATATPNRYPFGQTSFWRRPLTAAPLDPTWKPMAVYLASTVADRYGGVAAFNAHTYNSPLYVVTAATPRIDVAFDDCQGKGSTPSGLFGVAGQFEDVPVPADAVAATGSDGEISIHSPATDQLWEFWKAVKRPGGGWSACWGGRMDGVSTSPGHFTGAFGATATGLPNAGGAVRLSEITAGRIDHAISIAIPQPAVASRFSWPAQRSDGIDPNPAALPEGTRLRLDPALDLSTLRLTAPGLVIAKAAQKYGFVVVDRAGSVAVIAEAVPQTGASDPWYQVLKMPDYAVLKNFPWTSMQAVQRDFGKPAP